MKMSGGHNIKIMDSKSESSRGVGCHVLVTKMQRWQIFALSGVRADTLIGLFENKGKNSWLVSFRRQRLLRMVAAAGTMLWSWPGG